jgi:SOS-response transcriptional repressor LexA
MVTVTASFGNWLREEMDRHGVSQAALARLTRKSPGLVHAWVNDQKLPSSESCRLIAAALGHDEQYVLWKARHLTQLPAPPETYEVQSNIRFVRAALESMEGRLAADEVEIRFRGRLPTAPTQWVQMEGHGEPVRVPRRLIGERAPQSLFAITMSDDSLRGVGIHAGDLVYCERVPGREPHDGELVVVRLPDRVALHIWHRHGNQIELRDGDGAVAAQLSTLDAYDIEGFYRSDAACLPDVFPRPGG